MHRRPAPARSDDHAPSACASDAPSRTRVSTRAMSACERAVAGRDRADRGGDRATRSQLRSDVLEGLGYRGRDLSRAPLAHRQHADRRTERDDDRQPERDLRSAEPEADDARDRDRPQPGRERSLRRHVERPRRRGHAPIRLRNQTGTRRADPERVGPQPVRDRVPARRAREPRRGRDCRSMRRSGSRTRAIPGRCRPRFGAAGRVGDAQATSRSSTRVSNRCVRAPRPCPSSATATITRRPSRPRRTCTIASIADTSCRRTAGSGSATSAQSASVSIRASASSGLFACTVESEPS